MLPVLLSVLSAFPTLGLRADSPATSQQHAPATTAAPLIAAGPTAEQVTREEVAREEATGSTEEPSETSAVGDYAALLRELLSSADAQPRLRSLLPFNAFVVYLRSLSSADAEALFDRTALTDQETAAANELVRQQGDRESDVWTGTYEDNALRNAFRTVTAPVLAPNLMKMRRTAYTYSLEGLLPERNEKTEEKLRDMLLRGKVGLAQYSEQEQAYTLALPGDPNWRDGVRRCVVCHETREPVPDYDDSFPFRVIATSTQLLDTDNDGRVTAWDARQPLDTAILDGYRGVVTSPVTTDLAHAIGLGVASVDEASSPPAAVAASPEP